MTLIELLYIFLQLLPYLLSGVYTIVLIVKRVKAKRKAGTLTADDIINSALKIKEIARNSIYEAESQFKAMKQQGIKCGSFKLDSVLKTVDIECLKQGLQYDKEELKQFVCEEVKKMKEVV